MPKRVSISVIAEKLGVSPSTVSRALNGNPAISHEMVQKVKDLAQELHYVPNQMAVNLKSGRRNSIGVIIPLINRNFFSSVIEGIEDYAFTRGYDVIICQSKDSKEREERLVKSIGGKVDGVIASLAAHNMPHDYYNNLNVPIVLFDRIDRSIKASSVTVDDFGGAKMAVKHLLDQGFSKIYHFSGPRYVNVWGDRHSGYVEAMREAGIEPQQSWVFEAPTTLENGIKFAEQIIKSGNMPDAIFCSGDYAALGVMMEFKENNIDMPVVGFANEPFCSVIEPQLTSVNQHSAKIGMIACQLLLDILAGEPPVNTVITPELIVRRSSLRRNRKN